MDSKYFFNSINSSMSYQSSQISLDDFMNTLQHVESEIELPTEEADIIDDQDSGEFNRIQSRPFLDSQPERELSVITQDQRFSQPQPELCLQSKFHFLFNKVFIPQQVQSVSFPCALSFRSTTETVRQIQQNRLYVDLICVFDLSSSMSGAKLSLLKNTLTFMMTLLGQRDRIALVTFQIDANLVCPLTFMDEQGKQQLLIKFLELEAKGGTNLQAGLQLGFQALLNRGWQNQNTAMILLSDGLDNLLESFKQRKQSLFGRYKGELPYYFGIHTFGYGQDHDSQILQSISEQFGGRYYYIAQSEGIADAFASCLGQLFSARYKNIRVNLMNSPGPNDFQVSHVYSSVSDSGHVMSDLLSSDSKDLVFQLNYKQKSQTAKGKIAPLKMVVTYQEAKTRIKTSHEQNFQIEVTRNQDELQLNNHVVVNFYRVKSAQALQKVLQHCQKGQFEAGHNIAVQTANMLMNSIVKTDSVVLGLINDLKEAIRYSQSREEWNQGGRGFLLSACQSHMHQRASAYSNLYETNFQTAISKAAQGVGLQSPKKDHALDWQQNQENAAKKLRKMGNFYCLYVYNREQYFSLRRLTTAFYRRLIVKFNLEVDPFESLKKLRKRIEYFDLKRLRLMEELIMQQ